MKKIIIILILALAAYSAVFWFILDTKPIVVPGEISEEESVVTPKVPASNALCFARTQSVTEDAPYSVEEYIELKIENSTVFGTKQGTQAGPDMTNGYEGTFSGNVDEGKITVVFSYTVEGSSQKEQEEYMQKDGNLIKLRYPLVDKDDMLVPDKTKEATEIIYLSATCK